MLVILNVSPNCQIIWKVRLFRVRWIVYWVNDSVSHRYLLLFVSYSIWRGKNAFKNLRSSTLVHIQILIRSVRNFQISGSKCAYEYGPEIWGYRRNKQTSENSDRNWVKLYRVEIVSNDRHFAPAEMSVKWTLLIVSINKYKFFSFQDINFEKFVIFG